MMPKQIASILINDDIMLDVCRFLMREHIERFELVCHHWHWLIWLATNIWRRQLPLRPIQLLKIVLHGSNSYVEMTEFITFFKGVDWSYTWRPGDLDLRHFERQSERKLERRLIFLPLLFSNETVSHCDNSFPVSAISINLENFFLHNNPIWNGCFVRFMHLHIHDSTNLSVLISALQNGKHKKYEKQKVLDEKMAKINADDEQRRGQLLMTTKNCSENIELICIHFTSNCLHNGVIEHNTKKLLECSSKGWNNFGRGQTSTSEVCTSSTATDVGKSNNEFIGNSPKISMGTLTEFIGQMAIIMRPSVYVVYAPAFSVTELLASLLPVFPKYCCHIDFQIGNCCANSSFSSPAKANDNNNELTATINKHIMFDAAALRKMLCNLILADYSSRNNFPVELDKPINAKQQKQEQPPTSRRSVWKHLHDNNGGCTNLGCCEHALSSLTLHPLRIDAKLIDGIIDEFLALKSTDHLAGRRIHLYIGEQVDSLAADDFCHSYGDMDNDNVDEELHSAWRQIHRGNHLKMRSSRYGEYLAENPYTGLEICLQFITHRWKSTEYHSTIAKNEDDYPRYLCPYANSFVLELATC